jgi:hypothetical protein
MPTPSRKPYWIDRLWEKHECWTYGDSKSVGIELAGNPIYLFVPNYLPEFEVVTSARSGEPVFLIGRLNEDDEDDPYDLDGPLGVTVVARKQADDACSTVIWHEHYPYVFKYPGLEQPTGESDG